MHFNDSKFYRNFSIVTTFRWVDHQERFLNEQAVWSYKSCHLSHLYEGELFYVYKVPQTKNCLIALFSEHFQKCFNSENNKNELKESRGDKVVSLNQLRYT